MSLYRIKYKGLSDVRSISVKDAERSGVKLSGDLVWDRYGHQRDGHIAGINRPKHANIDQGILVEGLSEDFLTMLRKEGTFTVTEVKEDAPEGEPIIKGEPLDDTGSTVKDLTTGEESTKGDRDPNADPVPAKGKAKS